jgi:hypothetical protein
VITIAAVLALCHTGDRAERGGAGPEERGPAALLAEEDRILAGFHDQPRLVAPCRSLDAVTGGKPT